jgi:hypothetical protein
MNPWRLALGRHVDRSVRRKAIKQVIAFETLYILACLVVQFAVPANALTTLALSLLGGGLVLSVVALIFWLKRTYE